MTNKEAIKAIRIDGLTIEGSASRMLEFSRGLAKATEVLEEMDEIECSYKVTGCSDCDHRFDAIKYRFHDYQRNPLDYPGRTGKYLVYLEYNGSVDTEIRVFKKTDIGGFWVNPEFITHLIGWREIPPLG